jgi:hypothetical protein
VFDAWAPAERHSWQKDFQEKTSGVRHSRIDLVIQLAASNDRKRRQRGTKKGVTG